MLTLWRTSSTSLSLSLSLSLLASYVPTQWKSATIRPVAKIKYPTTPENFRPISVLQVISRLVERFIVLKYIYPAFSTSPLEEQLKDQFAFRPTGSTTAAIISIQHHTTEVLATNYSVTIIILSVDFTRAFDSIRHSTLTAMLAKADIPDFIYNWIVEFLKDRGRATKFAGSLSRLAYINASIVQGSAGAQLRGGLEGAQAPPSLKRCAL